MPHISLKPALDMLVETLANYGAAYAGCLVLCRTARRAATPSLWPAPERASIQSKTGQSA
jgi:hypothetical protein